MSGCASVHETHYFKAPHQGGETANYYRVTIEAKGRAPKVRYLAGYFDEKAVEQYFSEFTQPESLSTVVCPGCSTDGDEGGERLEPIDPKLAGRSLVLILSTNVDEIAAQIGALAENYQVQAALAGLARQDDAKRAQKARREVEADRRRARQLAITLRQVKEVLDGGAADAEKDEARLRAANALASYLGSTERFKDPSAAKAWLEANRGRIHQEMGR